MPRKPGLHCYQSKNKRFFLSSLGSFLSTRSKSSLAQGEENGELDAGRWTLDAGRWTLDAGRF